METYEGTAQLEWWVNRSTCFGHFPATVRADALDGGGWDVHGALVDASERENLQLAYWISPLFTLRFPDDSTFDVAIEPAESGFSVREWDDRVPDRATVFVFDPETDLPNPASA
ncbi:hypothetical protein [Fodinicola feengrottensis]|uniref:Uncharacterized protein n=1 Tax=Fodinicola feengrottensis TaxID=435914 RepID=A0ABN2FYI8_9ACTN|nr:hypothetical protein [Fodinicola feengrottensis]